MTVTAATPLAEDVSAEQAREELSKFFVIGDLAAKAPEMFSKFIDAEWHRLMKTEDYSAFCMMSVGHQVGDVEDKGYGTPSWLDLYHERFGTLPAAWFASAEGVVDLDAYESYMDSRTANVRFDCAPSTPDPDAALVVAWDCTPAPPDPDLKPKAKPGFITAWDWTPITGDPDYLKTTPDVPVPPVPDATAPAA